MVASGAAYLLNLRFPVSSRPDFWLIECDTFWQHVPAAIACTILAGPAQMLSHGEQWLVRVDPPSDSRRPPVAIAGGARERTPSEPVPGRTADVLDALRGQGAVIQGVLELGETSVPPRPAV
jgi:hypothetical protein